MEIDFCVEAYPLLQKRFVLVPKSRKGGKKNRIKKMGFVKKYAKEEKGEGI